MMAEKLPIKKQIAAMEGWAIKAKQDIYSGEYKKAAESLKNLNFEGRRLEWRGEEFGLKDLPEMEEVKALKKEISSARASALEIISMLDKIESFKKKYPDQKEFERKAKSNLDLSKKYAISMLEMVVRARAVVEKEPWKPENFPLIKTEKWFASIFEQFAKRKGYYKTYSTDYSLGGIDLGNALLVKANLEGAYLKEAYLQRANLEGANLKEADFRRTNLRKTNLKKADFKGANFMGADFVGANCVGTNFMGADLREADIGTGYSMGMYVGITNLREADLEGADLLEIFGLTLAQLHSAKNWEKAKNISRDLK